MTAIECFRFAKPGSRHSAGGPFYVYARRGENGWRAVGMTGTPEAWGNFANDAELMRLDMDRCASAELASEAFLRHARPGYEVEIV